MPLSPLDIQNKSFPNKMRGYNPDEVDDFLDQVVKDYEELTQKNRELEKNLKHANEKLEYFNELKDALNQSIIVAQDTADKVKSNASNEADVIVKSATQQADETTNNAQVRADNILNDAKQKATEILTDAVTNAKRLASETDDLKRKTRTFHQRLTLMLESQLQQVKTGEWDDLLKPFSTYIEDSHTAIKEILEKDEKAQAEVDKTDKEEVESKQDTEDANEASEGTTPAQELPVEDDATKDEATSKEDK